MSANFCTGTTPFCGQRLKAGLSRSVWKSKSTGVSPRLMIEMVWYTRPFWWHGGKRTCATDSSALGMNSCDPDANVWPVACSRSVHGTTNSLSSPSSRKLRIVLT